MNLFYCENIPENAVPPLAIMLDEEESRHAQKVLRLQPGDEMQVTSGRGYHYRGHIMGIKGKNLEVWLTEAEALFDFDRPRLHLAISPLKNPDRLEWLVEKATEMGVYKITFIQTQRTEKPRVNLERLKRLSVAALKQSLGAWLPILEGPLRFNELFSRAEEGEKFIAWCEGENSLLWEQLSGQKNAIILIGPEGDFTPEEAMEAQRRGFQPISLGQHRLRTETAGLVSIFAFQIQSRNL
ncbi:MAG: RsmE family RNA methyltransferase [Bacteroidales bacterium]